MRASKGTIIGAVIGIIFGGYAGAFIGALIGTMIGVRSDSRTDGAAKNIRSTASKQPSSQSTNPPPKKPLLAFFRLAGHLAKIDGQVSEAEANFISAFIRNLGVDNQALRTAYKRAFDQGKNYSDFSEDLNFLSSQKYSFRHLVLKMLCTLVCVNGAVTDTKRQFLLDAERILDLTGMVNSFFGDPQGRQKQRERRSTPPPPPPPPKPRDPLTEAYATLDCSPQDSDATVKRAWHRKTKEFHPDLLAGRGVPEKIIAMAEKEMKKINLAYETIMKSRHG